MPSSDYFVLPYVAQMGIPIRLIDSATEDLTSEALMPGTLVVFVRYIEPRCARMVDAVRDRLAGVALFMDDDLLDWRALAGLPMRYRYKIWRMSLRRRKWLQQTNCMLWVSTDYLAKKYGVLHANVVAPSASRDLLSRKAGIKVFYHGTASHPDEIRWLVPIVREVQKQRDDTFFEIFGRAEVNRQYRDIPRTAVLHPMSWPSYRDYTSLCQFDVGLAPLLPGRFGAGRSCTKFFDITRCGAVGVYSDVAPYAGFVRHGVDGLLLKNDPDVWVEAILRLVRDAETRSRMALAASERVGAV